MTNKAAHFRTAKFDTSFKCFVKISSNEEWLTFFSGHKANTVVIIR